MTFFKLVLRVWAVPVFLILAMKSWRLGGRRQSALIAMAFLSGPFFYSYGISKPYFGTFDSDNYSGYSLFANLTSHATCSDLISSFPAGASGSAGRSYSEVEGKVEALCTAEKLSVPSWIQLNKWDGFMRTIERELGQVQGGSNLNIFFRQWGLSLIVHHPHVMFSAMTQNLSMYLSIKPPMTLSYGRESFVEGCEAPVRELLGMSLVDYRSSAKKFVRDHRRELAIIDGIGSVLSTASRYFCFLFVFLLLTSEGIFGHFKIPALIGALAFAFCGVVLLAGYFEPRAFPVVDYLLWLSLGLAIGERWPAWIFKTSGARAWRKIFCGSRTVE